jgi:hypothetical protein
LRFLCSEDVGIKMNKFLEDYLIDVSIVAKIIIAINCELIGGAL